MKAAHWWKLALPGIVLVALAVLWWRRERPSPPPPPVTTVQEPAAGLLLPEPSRIAPGIYLLGKLNPAAAYVVDTSEGLVLIDSGLESDAEGVTSQLGKLGLDVHRVRAILLTHVHADHSLGAEHLRDVTGAKIYAGRGDCAPLRQGGPREAFFSTYHMPDVAAHPTTVDVELSGDETLAFGDTRFGVLATPGHTPGSVCYLLEGRGLRALFTGDIVWQLNAANGKTLGTYTAYLPPLYGGNAQDYLASLRRLRALPAPDLVLPGHPRMHTVPESPRLSAARWHALLDRGIEEMEKLLARYKADGANFLDGSPRELLPGLLYLGQYHDSAVYCLAAPKGLFLFDAPGDAGLGEFLATRLKELGRPGQKPVAILLTSAEEDATAGLAALVQGTGCQVVAPEAGLEKVKGLLPAGARVLTEKELEGSGWFEVRALAVPGHGVAPVAYQVRWAGKTVLLSGRSLVKVTATTGEQLLRTLQGPGARVDAYLNSLDQLKQLKPDLWLPAAPAEGQNANVYDEDWDQVIAQNRRVAELCQP